MYKEACSMLKRAGFWNDFKNYADLNDWVRPTLYGLGGAAAGGGIGAGVGALMGPENRGAKIGISAGALGLLGGLMGIGGGLAHNRQNRKSRRYQEYLAQEVKRALLIGDKAVATLRQKNTDAKLFMRNAKEALAFKQQLQNNKLLHAWHLEQREAAKNAAQNRMLGDWAQGKLDGKMDNNGRLIPDSVDPKYYDYPDSSGDLQDAVMLNMQNRLLEAKASMVDDVLNEHPLLYGENTAHKERARALLQRTYDAAIKGISAPTPSQLLDELQRSLLNTAKLIYRNKSDYFGGGPFVQ